MELTIKLSRETEAMLDELRRDSKRFKSIATKAGVSASRTMQTTVQRLIRSERAMKIGDVKKSLSLRYNPDAPSWGIRVNGDPIPVSQVKHRQTKAGVKFQPRKGKWALIEGGFIARMPTGYVGVFTRTGQGKRKRITLASGQRSTSELGLKKRFTSGIAAVFLDPNNRSTVEARTLEAFESTVQRLVKAGMR